MTQQQFIQEFKNYPQNQKSVVIKKLLQIYEEDRQKSANGDEVSADEKKAAYRRLRGALKMENPPMTKEEVREIYYEHLVEKHK